MGDFFGQIYDVEAVVDAVDDIEKRIDIETYVRNLAREDILLSGGTGGGGVAMSATNSNMLHFQKTAYNRGNTLIATSISSQAIYFASDNIAFTSAALDWTADQTVSVLATVATANQGVEFQSFSVRVQNP